MALILVIIGCVALIAALAVAGVRVGRQALELRRTARRSANARLEALIAVDRARERLAAASATTTEKRGELDAQVEQLQRARASLALLAEAAAEGLRPFRLPR